MDWERARRQLQNSLPSREVKRRMIVGVVCSASPALEDKMSAVLIAGTESGWYRGNVDALVPDGIESVFIGKAVLTSEGKREIKCQIP